MRILVAFDGSAGARAALREGVRLAAESSGELIVLDVIQPRADLGGIVAPTMAEALEQLTTERQHAAASAVRETGFNDATVRVDELPRERDVPEHIVAVAAEVGADMIVISSRRAAGVRGLVLGSVTQQVLRVSGIPVLVVRPPSDGVATEGSGA